MEWFFVFALGTLTGSIVTWLLISINNYWKRSKQLSASSAKIRKENIERAKKAKVDAAQARRAVVGSVFRSILLVVSVGFVGWAIWILLTG